jgi:protein-tyrosine phosphatase
MKILMVCLGNICRSPLAEGIMQKLIDDNKLNWSVASAGTNGLHNGEAPHKLSQKVATINGVNISHQRSQKITSNDIKNYDLIFAMADDVLYDIKKIAKNDFDDKKIQLFLANGNDVPDPWYGGEDGFHIVYDIIEKRCKELAQEYQI